MNELNKEYKEFLKQLNIINYVILSSNVVLLLLINIILYKEVLNNNLSIYTLIIINIGLIISDLFLFYILNKNKEINKESYQLLIEIKEQMDSLKNLDSNQSYKWNSSNQLLNQINFRNMNIDKVFANNILFKYKILSNKNKIIKNSQFLFLKKEIIKELNKCKDRVKNKEFKEIEYKAKNELTIEKFKQNL